MILPLVYYGNPVLRKKAKPVEKITQEICKLVADMIETMDANRGVGLAAPQVGVLLSIFVIRPEIVGPDGKFALGSPEVYINPILSSPSEKSQTYSEGCLSIPGLHVDVKRPYSIHIEAIDLNGNIISETIEGFKAVEIMHENDHLNGVMFIDRIEAFKKEEIKPALKEIKKNTSIV